jgi:hypothetical protein
MTTTDDRPAEHVIRHPSWCRHVPEDTPYTTDHTYDRLAPSGRAQEHELREYRFDAGDKFAYSLCVTPVQTYGLGVHDRDPVEHDLVRVRLSVRNIEVTDAYLSPAEIDTLVAMLMRAPRDAVRLIGAADGPTG